jgi:26S proteasome regulatory subunit T3
MAAVMSPLVDFSKEKMDVESSSSSRPSLAPHQQHDLYQEMKSKERELEFIELQEEYLKDEMRHLQRELLRAKEEIRRIQSVPLVIGQFNEMIDANYGIVSSTAGSNYYVRILSTLDREMLKPNTSIALHRHSHSVVDILPPESDSTVQLMTEKPDVTYKDIGGMDIQKQEVREAIELPLIQHHLYQQIGIDPPRGVLLYGPPGTGESLFVGRGCEYISITFPVIIVCLTTHTIHSLFLSIKCINVGKTMMAKAVANATSATFISMVGSEFVQKYLGEGPRMVRDVFRLARENSPCVIFIDEIDAIATKRFDAQTGADREVQRILLELLNQMDGFDQTTNVKVIMATNRADTLDPALLRPGRLDRKIEFPHPDRRQKRMVFQAATSKMNLSDELDLEDYVNRSEKVSCADVASICAEAGLQAIRENRYVVLPKDFDKAYKRAVSNREKELLFYSI